MKLIIFSLFIVFAFSAIESFSAQNAQKFLEAATERVVLISKVGEESDNAKNVLNELDAENTGLYITISDTEDKQALADRLADYIGVSIDSAPHLFFYDEKSNKFLFSGEYNLDAVKAFFDDVRNGKVKQHLKSDPIPTYSPDDVFQVVVGNNWIEQVIESDKESFAYIYAPWCGHCKTFAPIFEKLAQQFSVNKNIKFVKIDATTNDLPSFPPVQGFPTLVYFPKGGDQPFVNYEGNRQSDDVIEFIRSNTQFQWVDLNGEPAKNTESESANAQEVEL